MSKKEQPSTSVIKEVIAFFVDQKLQVKCYLNETRERKFKFAFYYYRKGTTNAIYKTAYTTFDTSEFIVDEAGTYLVKVFVRDIDSGATVTRMSEPATL